MKEVDYRLYPSKETQLQWLRSYLQAYKQLTQGDGGGAGVSEEELEALYVQVNKFSLVSGGGGKEPASLEGFSGDGFPSALSWGFVLARMGVQVPAGGVWGHLGLPPRAWLHLKHTEPSGKVKDSAGYLPSH